MILHPTSSLAAKSLAILVSATGLATSVQAATIGHWSFEQDALLSDSGPNNIGLYQFNHPTTGLQNSLPTQIALPATGAGSAFPRYVNGATNGHAIQGAGTTLSFNHRQLGADISAHDTNLTSALSFEAFVNLSNTNGGNPSVLAGQGVNSGSAGSWALSVTGESAGLGTRNIIFQMDPSGGWGGAGFQTLDSNLVLDLNKDYYIAVTADFSDNTTGITIYLKDLGDPEAVLQSATIAHSGTIAGTSEPLAIGASPTGGTPWYGLIDEVRLSDTKLGVQDLLVNQTQIPEPSSSALLVGGAFGLFVATRRRRRA
ncbi:MAG: LamG domain-containing protein [Verrucomicrobiota bacterium]